MILNISAKILDVIWWWRTKKRIKKVDVWVTKVVSRWETANSKGIGRAAANLGTASRVLLANTRLLLCIRIKHKLWSATRSGLTTRRCSSWVEIVPPAIKLGMRLYATYLTHMKTLTKCLMHLKSSLNLWTIWSKLTNWINCSNYSISMIVARQQTQDQSVNSSCVKNYILTL